MTIPNYCDFLLGVVNASAGRKAELKAALAKQWGWMAKVISEDTKEEIDNPVSFKEEFNRRHWEFSRQEAVVGQQKLDKEAKGTGDDFRDLVE